MPFSTLSGFEHAGEAEQRERNPRHVASKGGDKSTGEEKQLGQCVRRAELTERAGTMLTAGEGGKKGEGRGRLTDKLHQID